MPGVGSVWRSLHTAAGSLCPPLLSQQGPQPLLPHVALALTLALTLTLQGSL